MREGGCDRADLTLQLASLTFFAASFILRIEFSLLERSIVMCPRRTPRPMIIGSCHTSSLFMMNFAGSGDHPWGKKGSVAAVKRATISPCPTDTGKRSQTETTEMI